MLAEKNKEKKLFNSNSTIGKGKKSLVFIATNSFVSRKAKENKEEEEAESDIKNVHGHFK